MFSAMLITVLYATMYTAMVFMTHDVMYRLSAGHDMGIVVTISMITLALFGAARLTFISRRQLWQGHKNICRMKLEVKLCNSDTPPPKF